MGNVARFPWYHLNRPVVMMSQLACCAEPGDCLRDGGNLHRLFADGHVVIQLELPHGT